jgi:hypothetical protein
MLTVKHDLRSDPMCRDGVTIRHLADLHIGSPNCDLELVKSLVAENVANHWYTFLVGDLLDVGLKNSKSDVYTQTMTIDEAMDTACDILAPLADAGLILGAVQGNHENRLTRDAGVDITKNVMCRLHLEHLYNPHAILAFVQVGKQGNAGRRGSVYKWPHTYAIHVAHGNGGGTTAGGRANALVRARQKLDADVYLQGHTHHSDVQLGSCLRVNRSQISVKQVEQVFICCGSCLTYGDSYGESMNLAPSDNRYPRVFLHADNQLAEATV